MKRFMPVLFSVVALVLIGLATHGALPIIDEVIRDVWDSTNHTLQIEITQETVTGDLTVGDELTVTGNSTFSGFVDLPYQNITASTYSIVSTTKAVNYVVNYTDTGASGVTLDTDLLVDGRTITIKDGELNAGTNNITIGTEGAETIDEAATYTIDANGEAVTLMSDGTNWFVIGGYGE